MLNKETCKSYAGDKTLYEIKRDINCLIDSI